MLKALLKRIFRPRQAEVAAEAPRVATEPSLHHAAALFRQREYDAAASECMHIIAREPALPQAWSLLGGIAMERGEKQLARDHFETALRVGGDQVEALCNAAETNRQAGHGARALELATRALALQPDHWPALHIQGLAYQSCWRMDEALAVFRRLAEQQPGYSQGHASYLFLLVLTGAPPLAVLDAHRRWAAVNAEPLRAQETGFAGSVDPARPLRVGYVSADFREHALNSFFEPILARHDGGNFEIYCYSSTENIDAITRRLQSRARCWRDVRWKDDAAVAAQVHSDAIDILVDLSGHTTGNRLGVFARKPAPVQIAYVGYPATTGMSAIDYRVTDALVDPPGTADAYYTERLLRLPHSLWCFEPAANMPEPAPPPSARLGRVSFGSLNSMSKLTPEMIALWSRLLLCVPGSRLLLAAIPEGEARERIAAEFARHGVPADALSFHAPMAIGKFWDLHAEIDIALDAFPYNGGATTCVALWLGLPVVSLAGDLIWSRCGLSLLSAVGLPDLVADSEGAYLQIACALANDHERLAQLRRGMRERMRASALMDAETFTRDLECIYRDAWRTWCQHAPERQRGSA